MAKVTFNVATEPRELPAGQVAGMFRFLVAGQQQDVEGLSAVFDLGPGDYVATAQRMDTSGNPMSDAVSASFSVPVPSMFEAPVSLTVSLG